MRFEDVGGTRHPSWYAAFQEREASLSVEALPLSHLTAALLQRIPLRQLVEARQRNFAILAELLSPHDLLHRSPSKIAPFGFVIKVDDAASLAAALATERFFCARHWADLASDATIFPKEHALSRHLLPCLAIIAMKGPSLSGWRTPFAASSDSAKANRMASTFEGRRDWLNHWNGVAKRAGPEEFLRQVERTVGGKPTNDLQIALDVRATCQALELNASDCLLDLCCGNGLVTFRLASVCQSVYAVDFSSDLIMVERVTTPLLTSAIFFLLQRS